MAHTVSKDSSQCLVLLILHQDVSCFKRHKQGVKCTENTADSTCNQNLIRDDRELMASVNIREHSQRTEMLGRKKGREGRTSWEESKTKVKAKENQYKICSADQDKKKKPGWPKCREGNREDEVSEQRDLGPNPWVRKKTTTHRGISEPALSLFQIPAENKRAFLLAHFGFFFAWPPI